MRPFLRPLVGSAGLAGVGALATVLAAAPSSAAPTAAAPTAADQRFVAANEQSNLAEISLGTLAMSKSQDAATTALARQTKSDHVTAKAKLTAASTASKLTLPTAPNAVQLTVATQLKDTPASSFDLMYATAQVTAHQEALAAARTELSTTKVAALKTYTTFYIGIATMHLRMARAEVEALGGSPTVVAAGSGGGAATNSADDTAGEWGIAGGGVLVIAGSVLLLRRRRTAATA